MSKLNSDLEVLKYPIGKYQTPDIISEEHLSHWIRTIRDFPFVLYQRSVEITDEQLRWSYRPNGWSIRQLIHHCADSHLNSFIRFKWALTEETPTIKAYDEGRWASLTDGIKSPISASLTLLDGLHERWVILLESLTSKQLHQTFIHPESKNEISLMENIGLYAWHCEHHLAHIHFALEFEAKYKEK
jgi:hypothetical protein